MSEAKTTRPSGAWGQTMAQIAALTARVEALEARQLSPAYSVDSPNGTDVLSCAELELLVRLVQAVAQSPQLRNALQTLWVDQIEALVPQDERKLSAFLQHPVITGV